MNTAGLVLDDDDTGDLMGTVSGQQSCFQVGGQQAAPRR